MTAFERQQPTSKLALAAEIVGFVLFAFLSRQAVMLLTWKYAGPISLIATVTLLALYLRKRYGMQLRDIGLVPVRGWRAALKQFGLALLSFVGFGIAVGSMLWIGETFGLEQPDKTGGEIARRWGDIEGNLPQLLLWLGIAWVAAALCEELFFRGYLVTRIGQLFGNAKAGMALAVVIAALIFGFGHYYYQGLYGFLMTGLIALAFGTMFLLFKRNLWPLVILHGVVDSINFIALYAGEA